MCWIPTALYMGRRSNSKCLSSWWWLMSASNCSVPPQAIAAPVSLNSGGLSALPLGKGSAYSSGPLPGSCLIMFFAWGLARSKHHLKYPPQCVLRGWWSWQEVFNWLPLLLLSPFLKIFSNVISSTPVIRTLLSCVSLMPTLLMRLLEENRYFQAQSSLCPAMFIPVVATMNLFLA